MRVRPNIKYRFYPSLLDAFGSYLDTDPEKFFYQDESGKWHLNYNSSTGEFHFTDEEVDALARQRLIDTINRVGFVSEAADKGSCFNEVLDCIIKNVKSTRSDIKVSVKDSIVKAEADGLVNPADGKVIGGDVTFSEIPLRHIEAEMNGYVFRFDIDFCKQAANYFKGSMCQVFTKAPISTAYGNVELYGYADYLRENKVYDAKTTSKYDWGKYSKGWQKHVYPYCFIESGKCTEIQDFEYTAFVLQGGKDPYSLITGKMFPEVYTYDHKASTSAIRGICERFIEFLEENREEITDKKIFNQL